MGAAASTAIDLLQNAPTDFRSLGGLTVVRVVGEFKYRCDDVGTYQQFAAAIGVYHEDLSAVSISIASEPLDLMWTLLTRTSGMFTEVASGDFDGVEEMRVIDVHSSRKIRANDKIELIINNGGTKTLLWNVGLRTLVLLP